MVAGPEEIAVDGVVEICAHASMQVHRRVRHAVSTAARPPLCGADLDVRGQAETFHNLVSVYQKLGLQEKSEQALQEYERLGSLGDGKFY